MVATVAGGEAAPRPPVAGRANGDESRSIRTKHDAKVGRWMPHITEMQRLVAELQAAWQPVRFTVTGVSLIGRGEPPDDVFRVAATVPFRGRGTQVSGSLDR